MDESFVFFRTALTAYFKKRKLLESKSQDQNNEKIWKVLLDESNQLITSHVKNPLKMSMI